MLKTRMGRTASLSLFLMGTVALSTISLPTYAVENTSTQAVTNVWDAWGVYDETSTQTVSHTPLTSTLKGITIEERGRTSVAYIAIKGRPLDYVNAYIHALERVQVTSLNQDEQLAYWLNLHNIGILKLFAKNEKATRSVKKYRGTPDMPGAKWSEKTFTVQGQPLSLQDIEQNILFRHWKDPLIIYGLSYGVKGSPSIGTAAFSGKTVKAQLARNAREFINSGKNIRAGRSVVRVSNLYIWNQESLFDGSEATILAHIQTYAKPRLAKRLASASSISKNRFNWTSNAFTPRAAPVYQGAQTRSGSGRGGGSFGGGS